MNKWLGNVTSNCALLDSGVSPMSCGFPDAAMETRHSKKASLRPLGLANRLSRGDQVAKDFTS